MQKKITFLFIFIISLIFTIQVCSADSDLKISVDSILPTNQITQNVNYFDLRMEPSQKQKIYIRVTNHSSEKVALKVVYSPAKTTSQGVIEYSENEDLTIESPSEYLFNNIIKGPKKISLKPKEIKNIEFDLKMPNEEFDGFIAGGIEFIQAVEPTNDTNTLRTQKSYLVGFKLSETDKKLPIDLSLKQTVVGTKNYKNAILVSLVNKNASYIEELTIQSTISKKEDSTILLESRIEQVRMAPHSVLEIPIYLDNILLDPDNYKIDLMIKDKKEFKKTWTQEFKVTKRDAELLKDNQKLMEDKSNTKLLWLIILISSTITFMYLRKNSLLKNKKVKDKKNDKK